MSSELPVLLLVPQAAGTAQYTDDIPLAQGALWAAFVTATVPVGKVRAEPLHPALSISIWTTSGLILRAAADDCFVWFAPRLHGSVMQVRVPLHEQVSLHA